MNRPLVLLAAALLCAAGCLSAPFRMGRAVKTADALVALLHENGFETDHVGLVRLPYLTEEGQAYRVIGADVIQVFEYAHAEQAESEARRIDGRLLHRAGGAYYHRGHLIVRHLGTNGSLGLVLADALGPRLV